MRYTVFLFLLSFDEMIKIPWSIYLHFKYPKYVCTSARMHVWVCVYSYSMLLLLLMFLNSNISECVIWRYFYWCVHIKKKLKELVLVYHAVVIWQVSLSLNIKSTFFFLFHQIIVDEKKRKHSTVNLSCFYFFLKIPTNCKRNGTQTCQHAYVVNNT